MAKKIKIDVTDLIGKIKERRIPFYPVMMYVLLKSLNAAEGEIFFEQEKELFLKTIYNSDFDVFFKNYVQDCYEEKKHEKTEDDKLFFALEERPKADFVLYPLSQDGKKIILTILINKDINADFENVCQQACFDF